jgi:L-iditol 2-dehydrogenase
MKVARLHRPRDIRLHHEQSPAPGEGEELVRVSAVGLCGSDRHWFLEGGIGDATLSRPLVLGHEICGVIEGGTRHGEFVAVDPAVPCDVCDICLGGQGHLCQHMRFAGHGTTDGGLRQQMAWPTRQLLTLPSTIGAPEASLLEPLAVALHAAGLGQIEAGMSAGVYGCGPIGLLLIQILRNSGVNPIFATDPLAHRRDAATAAGATNVGAGGGGLPAVDVAFETAGENAAVDDAVDAVRAGGRVVLVGIPATDRTSFSASVARRKGLTLLLTRRSRPVDLRRAVELVTDSSIDLRSLVSASYPIDEVADAFAAHAAMQGLKIVVTL